MHRFESARNRVNVLYECVVVYRLTGQSLVVVVRRRVESVSRHRPYVPSGLPHVDRTTRRPPVTGVLGRRDLPSRGLPANAPIKRCRVDSSPTRPSDIDRFVILRDDVTDEEDDWNKENRRPDLSHEHVVSVARRRRRRRDDCDASSSSSSSISRCADRHQHSPINHVYHTLEPTAAADCRPPADHVFSPVYECIDSDDIVDVSAELCGQRRPQSKLLSTSHVTTAKRRQHDSKIHKTKKRVTFNVSIRTQCL